MLDYFVYGLSSSAKLTYPGGLRLIHFTLSQLLIAAEARGRNRTMETEDLKYGRQPRLPLVGVSANLHRNTLSEQYLFVHSSGPSSQAA